MVRSAHHNQPCIGLQGAKEYLPLVVTVDGIEVKFYRMTPVAMAGDSLNHELHLFTNGAELLTSVLSVEEREASLARIIVRRIEKSHAAGPLLVGPPPHDPERLRKLTTGMPP